MKLEDLKVGDYITYKNYKHIYKIIRINHTEKHIWVQENLDSTKRECYFPFTCISDLELNKSYIFDKNMENLLK